MRVADLMTTCVRTVRTTTPLKQAAALMREHRVSGLPVVDGEGCVLGVVSEADVLRMLGSDQHAFETRDAMTSPAVTIARDASASQAAELMLEHSVNRLPVVAAGELVGIVSRSDLVRAYTRSDGEIAREIDAEITSSLNEGPQHVSVEIDGGRVAVTGVVDTLDDAQRLYRRLARVPGVVSVRSTVRWRRDPLISA